MHETKILCNILVFLDFILDDETFKALWDRYTTGDGIRYDDFMAILTKLKILKGNSNRHD